MVYSEIDWQVSGAADFERYMKKNHVKKETKWKRIIWKEEPDEIKANSEVLALIDANSDPEDNIQPHKLIAKTADIILPKHKLTRVEELFSNSYDFVK